MNREGIIDALAAYRRPGTPVYAYHFRRLPAEVLRPANVPALRAIVEDGTLPPRVREHAAGALGELRDRGAIGVLIKALDQAKLRRGAAIALGRMRAKRAVPALEAVAPRCKAARWALSQFDRPQPVPQLLDDLRDGHLREIGRKLDRVDRAKREAVREAVLRELRPVVAEGRLHADHRWLITALGLLGGDEADTVLSDALRLTLRKPGICPTVRGRLLRVMNERRSAATIPAFLDVACQTKDPVHAHMAVVAIEKIVQRQGRATATVLAQRPRLERQLARLKRLRADTEPVRPLRPWDHPPGSPRWFAAVDRAIAALERLLRRVG